ncbi:MAG: hypothetical protein RMK18_03860 [Armatimonadota bacterium]|nr:hypothetical protein [Armatimonadota bacterium]MCX7777158.1 hypothetical protein [Armatimonadota bacterium]MDW8024985.1 hypothetical protein [Armatimonadota bacterium]
MRLITQEQVEQVWSDMAKYGEREAEELDARVTSAQPNVLPFAFAVLDELPERAQEWAVHLSYLVTEVFLRASENALPAVSLEEFLIAYQRVGERLSELSEAAQAREESAPSITVDELTEQPNVLTTVIEVLEAGEEEGALSSSEASAIFCLMLAVINAYNEAWAHSSS